MNFRVDDLTKLIEDEVIADQDPAQGVITDTVNSKMVFEAHLEQLFQQAQCDNKSEQNTQVKFDSLTLFSIDTHFDASTLESFLKTLWEKEKLLVTSNFSFSRNVFYSIR